MWLDNAFAFTNYAKSAAGREGEGRGIALVGFETGGRGVGRIMYM